MKKGNISDINNELKQYGLGDYNKKNFISKIDSLCWGFSCDPYFLTLFYSRQNHTIFSILDFLKKDNSSLHICCNRLGSNIIMHHPYSTHINAKSIGDNFQFKNNTTIGNKNENQNERPTIGNNVNLGVNVTIFGDINIGNNVVIGAGSVVNKDIPDDCVVVGNPCKILK